MHEFEYADESAGFKARAICLCKQWNCAHDKPVVPEI
jgi:hypothetical protein